MSDKSGSTSQPTGSSRRTWAGPVSLLLVVVGAGVGAYIPFAVFLILAGVLVAWTKLPPTGTAGRRLHLVVILLGLLCLAVFVVVTITLALRAS